MPAEDARLRARDEYGPDGPPTKKRLASPVDGDVGEAARRLRERGFGRPMAAVILGSGLSAFSEGLGERLELPYSDVPGTPAPSIEGHGGALIQGLLGGRRVLVYSGRVHYYEGRSYEDVTWQVRLAAALGAETLVITNAAGGIDPGFEVGDIMLIVDQISTVTGRWRPRVRQTFRMAAAYSPGLVELAGREALANGLRVRRGVYMGSLGPSYETPAEIAFARAAGAHAVGMSTVAEVQTAHLLGLPVLGLSLITNVPLPGRFETTTHAEVLEAGRRGAAAMVSLVAAVLHKL
ncbi:MAG: purine-nucleoside phosphorylase [Candidatus Eisenbacteria bacterium]|nr:purine-nucleoside phosphorylase [Candidatus Eisenbacteria bacterium]